MTNVQLFKKMCRFSRISAVRCHFSPWSALPAILGIRLHCQSLRKRLHEILPLHLRAQPFDFTRRGRLGVCELLSERRQELRFASPKAFLVNSQFHAVHPVSKAFPVAAGRSRIALAFLCGKLFGTAGKGSPASHFFTSPDLIVLDVFILLRSTLLILLGCAIFILMCRERSGHARLEVRPRTPSQMS